MRGARSAIQSPLLLGTLLEERVVVRVRRRAAAEDPQLAGPVVLERVPRARRDQDCVARTKEARLAVELHLALTLEHEVDLFADAVIVALGRLPRLERRLGEALYVRLLQLADRRPVLRHERLHALDRPDVHQSAAASAS